VYYLIKRGSEVEGGIHQCVGFEDRIKGTKLMVQLSMDLEGI
jgi:hypothetical protein